MQLRCSPCHSAAVVGAIAMGFVQTLSGWIVLRAVTGIGSAWVLIFVSAWCLEHFNQVGRLD